MKLKHIFTCQATMKYRLPAQHLRSLARTSGHHGNKLSSCRGKRFVGFTCKPCANVFARRLYCTVGNSHSAEVTLSGSHTNNLSVTDNELVLTVGEYEVKLLYTWLRDHCRCDNCYNHVTFQKNVDNYTLSLMEKPRSVEYDGTILQLEWPDGHITSYNVDWLLQNTFHGRHNHPVTPFVWDGQTMQEENLPLVDAATFMESEDGLQKHLHNLVKYGFSIVNGVSATHEDTLRVAERVCFLQETHFGRDWTFTSNNERGDTAYTSLALGAHTDSTYFTTPCGIQVFHVLEHTGEGGKTLLVDGRHCAEILRSTDPKAFDFLTQAVVAHEYFEDKLKIRSLGTVLSVHPTTKEFLHLRFNPYDRSPLFTLPSDEQLMFYQYYDMLYNIIRDEGNEFWIQLQPDQVLFVDNWRVMHGRSGFTGRRRVSGCYLPRDDWTSAARQLGLLHL